MNACKFEVIKNQTHAFIRMAMTKPTVASCVKLQIIGSTIVLRASNSNVA